jgi:hypothetical protein
VKVPHRHTASDDIVRQFRYYLLTAEVPEIALRFREVVSRTIQSLSHSATTVQLLDGVADSAPRSSSVSCNNAFPSG